MDDSACDASPDIPNSVRERLAAILVDSLVARAKAQAGVQWVATFYGLSEESTATLLADLIPNTGGKVPPRGTV